MIKLSIGAFLLLVNVSVRICTDRIYSRADARTAPLLYKKIVANSYTLRTRAAPVFALSRKANNKLNIYFYLILRSNRHCLRKNTHFFLLSIFSTNFGALFHRERISIMCLDCELEKKQTALQNRGQAQHIWKRM